MTPTRWFDFVLLRLAGLLIGCGCATFGVGGLLIGLGVGIAACALVHSPESGETPSAAVRIKVE